MLVPVSLLVALLWWRFYGSGKDSTNIIGKPKPGNYKTLKTYKYEVRNFVSPVIEKPEASPEIMPGNILDDLVSEEEYLTAKNTTGIFIDSEDTEANIFADSENSLNLATEHIYSITNASNEVAAVPEVRETITLDVSPEIKQEDGPAQSLYYNPLTAPAPTDNDKKNREAEIALKKRRRAELKNNSSSAQPVFGELFSPDSPVKSTSVIVGSDNKWFNN